MRAVKYNTTFELATSLTLLLVNIFYDSNVIV